MQYLHVINESFSGGISKSNVFKLIKLRRSCTKNTLKAKPPKN